MCRYPLRVSDHGCQARREACRLERGIPRRRRTNVGLSGTMSAERFSARCIGGMDIEIRPRPIIAHKECGAIFESAVKMHNGSTRTAFLRYDTIARLQNEAAMNTHRQIVRDWRRGGQRLARCAVPRTNRICRSVAPSNREPETNFGSRTAKAPAPASSIAMASGTIHCAAT